MAAKLPIIYIFGTEGISLRSSPTPPETETAELECHCFPNDRDLESLLVRQKPHVLISVGDIKDFPFLLAAPFEIRRRWLHYPDLNDLDKIGSDAFYCYMAVCIDKRSEEPLVSIFTPAYRSGSRFIRALNSVLAQHYTNWEWVVWDDSDDDGATAGMIRQLAGKDQRITLITPQAHSGVIGEVKYNACMASHGDILVEFDHDDEFTPDALIHVVNAWRKYPECGFFYSDFAEVDARMQPLRYPDGWGYGYGSYRNENYRGTVLTVANAPNINAKTIRGLIAAPNHLRAWRRDIYLSLGGHNRLLHVADDMDLMIRTFLVTRMLRIPKLCYLQYQEGDNTQRIRNKDIQRHVRWLKWKYDAQIHERFVALGVDDWIWNEQEKYSDLATPNPPVEPAASLIAAD
jgi:glycosyltransferase involved in cell wall biosynthesis